MMSSSHRQRAGQPTGFSRATRRPTCSRLFLRDRHPRRHLRRQSALLSLSSARLPRRSLARLQTQAHGPRCSAHQPQAIVSARSTRARERGPAPRHPQPSRTRTHHQRHMYLSSFRRGHRHPQAPRCRPGAPPLRSRRRLLEAAQSSLSNSRQPPSACLLLRLGTT